MRPEGGSPWPYVVVVDDPGHTQRYEFVVNAEDDAAARTEGAGLALGRELFGAPYGHDGYVSADVVVRAAGAYLDGEPYDGGEPTAEGYAAIGAMFAVAWPVVPDLWRPRGVPLGVVAMPVTPRLVPGTSWRPAIQALREWVELHGPVQLVAR